MGDGRAEGSSAIGDRGRAAISLTPDIDGTGSRSILSIKILYYCTLYSTVQYSTQKHNHL